MNRTPRRRPRATTHGALSHAHRVQIDAKRATTLQLVVADAPVTGRIATAPPGYLLAIARSDVARQCALIEPLPAPDEVRVVVTPGCTQGSWHLDLATRDRPALLAAFSRVLADAGIDVTQAVVATWPDGAALQALLIHADSPPDTSSLAAALGAARSQPISAPPIPDARITFDQHASPLYTSCRVDAPDRPGLLAAIASAIAATGTDVHAASVATHGGVACDRFDLADRAGRKLGIACQDDIRAALRDGIEPVLAR